MNKVICADFKDNLRNKQTDVPVEEPTKAMKTLESKGFAIIISSARLDPVL
jgi:hypothetical protein